MADLKTKYPAASSVDVTMDLASLATNAVGVYLAGQTSTAVDNTTTQDLDHLLSGVIVAGSVAPTASRSINVYAYAATSTAAGVPTYPDGITGTDAAKTMTSANVQNSALKFVASITIDATAGRVYTFAPVSIASLFGGVLPKFYGIFVAHDTAQALGATGHKLSFERIQGQTV